MLRNNWRGEKEREVKDVFGEEQFNLLALTETKIKGCGKNERLELKCIGVFQFRGMGRGEKEMPF